MRMPVKVYAILTKGSISAMSPVTTIQGDTYVLSEEEIKNWENTKQKIINDFVSKLWRKGDKGKPSGRKEWAPYVKIITIKPKLPKWVEEKIEEKEIEWTPFTSYDEYIWRGRPAYAIRERGKFKTWGFRPE